MMNFHFETAINICVKHILKYAFKLQNFYSKNAFTQLLYYTLYDTNIALKGDTAILKGPYVARDF